MFVVVGWICLQRRPEVDWSNKNTCLPSNSNSWEMLNIKYHFYIKQCFPVKVTFGNVLVWFLIWSNGRGAGRLVCTTKWEINNRQTPNGAILLCQALFFFFIFFQKPNQSSNTYLEEFSSETTNLKPLLLIQFTILRKIHCFEFTET